MASADDAISMPAANARQTIFPFMRPGPPANTTPSFPALNPMPDPMPDIAKEGGAYQLSVKNAIDIYYSHESAKVAEEWRVLPLGPRALLTGQVDKDTILYCRSQSHMNLTRAIMSEPGQMPLNPASVFQSANSQVLSDAMGLAYTRRYPSASDRWDTPIRGTDDDVNWINHTYFPVCFIGGPSPWVGLFVVFYASCRPEDKIVGHVAEWAEVGNGEGGRVTVDVSLLNDQNSQLAMGAAIDSCRPQSGSFIWISDYSSFDKANAPYDFSDAPSRVSGSSLGHAVAACIMGCAPVMYTGYIKKWPDIAKIASTVSAPGAADSRPQKILEWKEAVMTDDIIEDVNLLPLKCVFALHTNIPLILPHKSNFNQALDKILATSPLLQFYVPNKQYMLSTVQFNQGFQYFATGRKVPLLLSTTLSETIFLSACAWTAYCIFFNVAGMKIQLARANEYANYAYGKRESRGIVNSQNRAFLAGLDDPQYYTYKQEAIDQAYAEAEAGAKSRLEKKQAQLKQGKEKRLGRLEAAKKEGRRTVAQKKGMSDARAKALQAAKAKKVAAKAVKAQKLVVKPPAKRAEAQQRRADSLKYAPPDSKIAKQAARRLTIPQLSLVRGVPFRNTSGAAAQLAQEQNEPQPDLGQGAPPADTTGMVEVEPGMWITQQEYDKVLEATSASKKPTLRKPS